MSLSRYVTIHVGFALLALTAILGVTFTLPWLWAENFRLTTWELALIWSGEVAAVVWFVYMWIRFSITWELDSAFTDRTAHEPLTQIFAIVILLIGAVDLTATFLLKDYVVQRRAKAEEGVCRITKTKLYSLRHGRLFTAFAWCEVIDKQGKSHTSYYFGPQSRFPDSVHNAILTQRLPVEMPVEYDPQRPQRFWTSLSTYGDWNGWRFSQEITACAMGLALLALVSRHFLLFVALPVEVCPLLGATVRIMGAGFYMWVKGQTALPPF